MHKIKSVLWQDQKIIVGNLFYIRSKGQTVLEAEITEITAHIERGVQTVTINFEDLSFVELFDVKLIYYQLERA